MNTACECLNIKLTTNELSVFPESVAKRTIYTSSRFAWIFSNILKIFPTKRQAITGYATFPRIYPLYSGVQLHYMAVHYALCGNKPSNCRTGQQFAKYITDFKFSSITFIHEKIRCNSSLPGSFRDDDF